MSLSVHETNSVGRINEPISAHMYVLILGVVEVVLLFVLLSSCAIGLKYLCFHPVKSEASSELSLSVKGKCSRRQHLQCTHNINRKKK